MTWVALADASLPDGALIDASVGDTRIALAHAERAWHAVETWCTHAECLLSDGWVEGAAVRCPCHGSLFDLATGEALEGPAVEPVRTFPTRVVAGRVEVDVA